MGLALDEPTETDERIDQDGMTFVLDPDGNNVEAVCHAPE